MGDAALAKAPPGSPPAARAGPARFPAEQLTEKGIGCHMKIETYIDSLVSYAVDRALAENADRQVLTNRLLDLLGKDDYESSDGPLLEDLASSGN